MNRFIIYNSRNASAMQCFSNAGLLHKAFAIDGKFYHFEQIAKMAQEKGKVFFKEMSGREHLLEWDDQHKFYDLCDVKY